MFQSVICSFDFFTYSAIYITILDLMDENNLIFRYFICGMVEIISQLDIFNLSCFHNTLFHACIQLLSKIVYMHFVIAALRVLIIG